MDVVTVPSLANAKALIDALVAFGFGGLELSPEDFTRDVTIALGKAPHQIDIMTYIKGVDVEDAWERRQVGSLDGIPVAFIAKADLIANKCGFHPIVITHFTSS